MSTKIILLSIALVAGTVLCAQEKKVVKKESKPIEAAKAPAYLGKEWKINSIEEFGVLKKAKGKNQNDMLLLNTDNTFKIRLDSVEKTGKYTRAGKSITLKTDDSKVYHLNVLHDGNDTLKIKCQDPDLVTYLFKYILK